MVQAGHGLQAAPRTTPPADGTVPPPPPGELVPHEGYVVFADAEHRLTFAGCMLAIHRPGPRHLELRLGWPPRLRVRRQCTWCTDPWTCTTAQWARAVPERPVDPATPGAPASSAPLWDGPTLISWPMAGVFTYAQLWRGHGGRQ
ncbi:hypothetical protein [Micromonospora ureilytica]|uniref:hypothetical protein n=1 Tax=Micromonospora ureilytica TaxID=709868 RepID=UPI000F5E0FFA|nr:hypothetical protein [Micromonospora ureilytica]